jgi:hypothetical protein
MDTIYGYFSLPVSNSYARGKKFKNSGKGYVCIRIDRPDKDSNDYTYEATLSFCSPFDQFSKKQGRKIADSRMAFKGKQGVSGDARIRTIKVSYDKRPKMQDVFRDVLIQACTTEVRSGRGKPRPLMPRWFRASAEDGIIPGDIKYGLRTR